MRWLRRPLENRQSNTSWAAEDALPSEARALPALTLSNLTVRYGSTLALGPVDYVAPLPSLIAVIGPNGAGKSTLLKAVMGLLPSHTGQVLIYGQPLTQRRLQVAYVPQRESVDWDFPASVFDVVAMGLYGRLGWLRPLRKRHREQVYYYLEQLGLTALAQRQIGQLSGGQQQRAFIARALVQQAWLYLMDEPLAGIDAATEQVLLAQLRALQQQGKTIICVHHDLNSVADYFDHALLLNGRKLTDGPVNSVLTNANLQLAYGGGRWAT